MTVPSDPEYARVRGLPTLVGLEPREALNALAYLVDGAGDRADNDGLSHALQLADGLLSEPTYSALPHPGGSYLHYFVANAFDLRRTLATARNEWDWDDPDMDAEVLHLRQALQADDLPPDLATRATTNLANTFSRTGRLIEAIELFDKARGLDPTYGMPSANRAITLHTLATCVPDPGHACTLLAAAADQYRAALEQPVDDPSIRKGMKAQLARLESYLSKHLPLRPAAPAKSKAEARYRAWTLDYRLFLHPLNDVGLGIATDMIRPTTMKVKRGTGPYLLGFFNGIKQEYAAARFLLFEAAHRSRPHYADRCVVLTDALDHSVYGLSIEQIKISYRLAYAVLDKVAFFLNDYLDLGVSEKKVSFSRFWYVKQEPQRGLIAPFRNRPNLPLRGLYWLSKDLYEGREHHRNALEPMARDLAEVRHWLEHKYFKVVAIKATGLAADRFSDPLGRSATYDELSAQALHALKVARTAILQLACAIAVEERRDDGNAGKQGSLPLPDIPPRLRL